MILLSKFKDINNVSNNDWPEFWGELQVNYERINEYPNLIEKIIEPLLANLPINELYDICSLLNIKVESDDKQVVINALKAVESITNLAYLKSFILRKKRAIQKFYELRFSNSYKRFDSSVFIQLLHLFYEYPSNLFEVLTLHEWELKGTGDLYKCDKIFSEDNLNKLHVDADFQKKLTDTLTKSSSYEHKYKFQTSCLLHKNHGIFLLYKLTKDVAKPDFDKAKRVKDVDILMFSVDLNEEILHIKVKTQRELLGIKSFFESEIGNQLTKYETATYDKYEPENIVNALKQPIKLETSKVTPLQKSITPGFQINKIAFSGCTLSRSPEITLFSPNSDVWDSVISAFNLGLLEIDSLSYIKSINIKFGSNSRIIRTTILEDGDVIFKLDDSGLDAGVKTQINEKFINIFGLPLNTRIKNKFEKGLLERIDFLMRVPLISRIGNGYDGIMNKLIEDGIIISTPMKKYKCMNIECNHETYLEVDFKDGCPNCLEKKYDCVIYDNELTTSKSKIDKLVSDTFNSILSSESETRLLHKSILKIYDSEYEFYRFLYKKHQYQVITTDKVLPRRILGAIEKQLIPTIIVYYAVDKSQVILMTPNTIETLYFSEIYTHKDEYDKLKTILKIKLNNLESRTQLHISSAASLSSESLKTIIGKTEELKDKYKPSELEDDVYPILKDIIPNSEKWGKEFTGKPLPEGLLAIQYRESKNMNQKEIKYIFTYDCKLTTSKDGYDLSSSEKRKATEYVTKINNLKEVSAYCTDRQVSAHIFISNKFKSSQIQAMGDYFYETLSDNASTKPVFLLVDHLVELHNWYTKNINNIKKIYDIFYQSLYELFTPEKYLITEESIHKFFNDVEYFFNDLRDLDTSRIKQKVLDRK